MEWIQVNDRMPEHEKEVLIYSEWDGIAVGHWDQVKNNFFRGLLVTIHVTHWMELPEKPLFVTSGL